MPLLSQAIKTSSYCKNERDGIKAWWDLYNTKSYVGSGSSIVDATSNGAPTLTMNNGAIYDTDYGGVITLDGINDYASAGSNSYMDFMKNASFSIDIWFRPLESPPSEQVLFCCTGTEGSTVSTDIHIRIYDTGKVRFAYYGDDLDTSTGVVFFFDTSSCDNWHNIVCTYNSGTDTSKIYVNGTEQASGSQGPFTGSSASVGIGAWQNAIAGNGQYCKGQFQSVTLYNKALSSTDILQNYYSRSYRLFGPCV